MNDIQTTPVPVQKKDYVTSYAEVRRLRECHVRLCAYVNGVEAKEVLDANPEEGWIEVIQRDSRGRLIIHGSAVARERRFGFVEVERL